MNWMTISFWTMCQPTTVSSHVETRSKMGTAASRGALVYRYRTNFFTINSGTSYQPGPGRDLVRLGGGTSTSSTCPYHT